MTEFILNDFRMKFKCHFFFSSGELNSGKPRSKVKKNLVNKKKHTA